MPATSGLTAAQQIAKVRRMLRDNPTWVPEKYPTDGVTGAITPGSKPFKLQHPPIMLSPLPVVTAPGGPYTVDFDDNGDVPAAGHVNIVSDTGEVIFPVAPALGTFAISYKGARFSDQQIKDALLEGMNMLWPEIWNPATDTTTIAVSPTQFEYSLSTLFQDQRCVILEVEYSPPSGFIRYYRTSLWRTLEDVQNPTLIFSELPPISSIIRITYSKTFAQLSEIPDQVAHLPRYYATARLLADQETMRSRSDDLPALTGENANPAGTSLAAAAFWLERFAEQVSKLALDLPARRSVADRSVEALGLSEFWTHVA
jgi:hypothetical protein